MIRNYFRTALRFLKKNKVFAGINILGLSIALATSFIILLFVINELSYDSLHKNRKQIYRVLENLEESNMTMAGTPYVLASVLKDEFPQVERVVRVRRVRGFRLKLNDDMIPVWNCISADSDVFNIFTLPLIGSTLNNDLLDDLNAIVLSREMAEKFFPGEDPVGKEIVAFVNQAEHVFIVNGVFEDIPENSTFRAKCFVNSKWSLDPINESFEISDADVNWRMSFWNTYVLLTKDCNVGLLEDQFRGFEKKNLPQGSKKHFSLQNLSNVYLGSKDVANSFIQGDRKNVRLFTGIALLIVLIAAINYILLSTAVSTSRAKEIGIRKTTGASDRIIRNQLLSESVILALAVLPFALILMWLGIPQAEILFDTTLTIYNSNLFIYIAVYLALTILIGIASGLYTSAYLSRLKVMEILNRTVHSGRKKQLFRSVLIVVQLVIFCAFVSATLIIRTQYRFALNIEPGYRSKNIVLVELGSGFKEYVPFINSVRAISNVRSAGGAFEGLPMENTMISMVPHAENEEIKVKVEGMSVDYQFLETMGIVVNGRYFSEEFGSDLEEAVILNETAVEALGITDPIGKKMLRKTIIGVADDFNIHSIHTKIPPIRIYLNKQYILELAVHYEPGTLGEVLPMIKENWERVNPDKAFTYSLIEEVNENLYLKEKRLGTIVSVSALFALLIAAMGIFGLTLFVARSRTNEIGIRKVFGSSEWSIIGSFLKTNFILVLVAEVISIPVTIYFMRRWLENFSFRISIPWWVFAAAFIIATVVVLLTVFIQSYRSSRINPVDALRDE